MTNQIEAMMRPPYEVMRLDRMGAAFQTRLSFMRVLVRRMARENWQFSQTTFELDEKGLGHAVYTVDTGKRSYSLIAFSHDLDTGLRSKCVARGNHAAGRHHDGAAELGIAVRPVVTGTRHL